MLALVQVLQPGWTGQSGVSAQPVVEKEDAYFDHAFVSQMTLRSFVKGKELSSWSAFPIHVHGQSIR